MLSTPAALALYLQTYAAPFDWQRAHCGDFIGGWVQACTGRSPVRGMARHASALAWRRAIDGAGGFTALVSARLGCAPVEPTRAHIGDVVLLPGDMAGGTLGLCAGRTAVCVDDAGACVHVPMALALHAWPLAEVRP